MTIPLVTVIDPVPLRSATPEPEFRADVEEFLEELPPFTTEFNASVTAINSTATTIDDQATATAANALAAQEAYEALVASDLGEMSGTSTTSNAIATGAKTFATQAGKLWRVNQWVMIRSQANAANFMVGPITAYDVSDGNPLTVDVQQIGGSGTFTDWQIYTVGAPQPAVGLNIISSATVASPVAAIDIVSGLDATYDEYELHLFNLVAASASSFLRARTSTDGGSSFASGASDYSRLSFGVNGTADSYIPLTLNVVGTNAADGGYTGVVKLFRPSSSVKFRMNSIGVSCEGSAANQVRLEGAGGERAQVAAINAIRIYMSTGNIASGMYKLYGVKK